MQNLERLFGRDWIQREVLTSQPRHPLGKWQNYQAENPLTKYTDELVGVAFKRDKLRCDTERLATKLQGEFEDTLTELGYAVFLTQSGLRVTMEPTAPLAGPDLKAEKDSEYYVEIRRVGLDEVHAAVDLATEDVFDRLCGTPSRYTVIISMTDEYSAHSPQLKRATRTVERTLRDLGHRAVHQARMYYYGPDEYEISEEDEAGRQYDYGDHARLALQIVAQERRDKARFVARFDDTGQENARTAVAVHPLRPQRHLVQPDQTYDRLKRILRKKQKQLPKGGRGVILLEITDLAKLGIDDFTLQRALYGDLQVTIRNEAGFPDDWSRKANGFFLGTTRVSAVVFERMHIGKDEISFARQVFPTNNPHANVLTLEELKLFGTIAKDFENLSAGTSNDR